MGTRSTTAVATDSTLYYKAVGSIFIYFATVISALVICIARTRFSASNAVYILISICSLFTTWYYILSFFKKEYESLGSDLDRFILESDLFVQAYAIVTNTLPKWWWSSQLLILTGTALTCWSVEGQTARLETEEINKRTAKPTKKWTPTWWFVLLGFFGSMSVGGPLFLAQLDPAPKMRSQARTVPIILAILILLGEVSVIATPFFESMSQGFKWNLVLTHALFLVPSFLSFNPESQKRFTTIRLPVLYFLLSIIALLSHAMYTLPFVLSPIMKPIILYKALWFNHCQTSISADLIFNNILAAFYMIHSSRQMKKPHMGVLLSLLMPVLSVSTILPLYLGWKERQLIVKETPKEKKA
ncbi:asparagine-linked glycosylation protein [Mortierella sp. AD011]|nr:asparagine-linked glycosylation protein [Mortierella sp. AD010]KAF9403114.1 asparagine-linked glycosylation protein [Mortierella sp. AD011]